MSNVTLPQFPDIAPTDDWDSVIECVNSYAEAYAAERVREALDQAAGICKELQCSPELTPEVKDNWLAIAEKRIRELMQKGI